MKIIILAGGLGCRLRPITNNRPKCMLDINGKSIIERQLDAFAPFGLDQDVVVVTGYQDEVVKRNYRNLKYIHDEGFKIPGIVRGIFCAAEEMSGGFIFSYSDIIYGANTVRKMLETDGHIVVVADTNWKKQYEGRTKHPLSEAELLTADEDGNVIKIGKDVVSIDEAFGEFIGLAKFSNQGANTARRVYYRLLEEYKPTDPFQNAKEFQRAYLTDFIQELVDWEIEVKVAPIDFVWTEIDTDEDLERARKTWK